MQHVCVMEKCVALRYVKPIAVEPYGQWTDLDQHLPQCITQCLGVTYCIFLFMQMCACHCVSIISKDMSRPLCLLFVEL